MAPPSQELEPPANPGRFRKGKSGRLLRRPQRVHPAAPVADFVTAVLTGEKTGRRVYGLELSETFCDVVIARWQTFTGKIATLDGEDCSFEDVKLERLGSGGAVEAA